MSIRINTFTSLTAAALLFSAAQRQSLAGSATWGNNPSSSDWNTAANWMPQTVPNSTMDIATFGTSSLTNISSEDTTINLDSAVFSSGAPPYTITLSVSALELNGAGIVNNSGSVQSFGIPTEGNLVGFVFFYNSSTAGNMTNFSTVGGSIDFFDSSSAGSATFDLSDNMFQASLTFWDSSTAADATISGSDGAQINLFGNATGGNATFTVSGGAFLDVLENATAEHAVATCIGGNQIAGSSLFFQTNASAGEGTFTAVGASSSGEKGGFIQFTGNATANSGTFVINGGLGAGLAATTLTFFDTTTAAAAKMTANGGEGGSDGGAVIFTKKSKGSTASITLSGNAELDISTHNAPGVTIGSLAGAGSVLLGANALTVGGNNQSTTFSGVIQGGGGVTKTGTGTLTLSGANTYTGGTTVSAGALVVSNTSGSATGTGSVAINSGTLGGGGTISGAVTVGTGSGAGATLQPSFGTTKKVALTIQSLLTFKSDATYSFRLKSKAAEVIANGVTIETGAQFVLTAPNKKLPAGKSATVIKNTAASAISGTFANLRDGGTITSGSNTYQASYEGGDGNDLTLTVLP